MREWFENRTVSLVGNASSMFSKRNGVKIDSSEIIVRLNKGILASFDSSHASFVGSKTDVWMFNLYNENTKRIEEQISTKKFKKMQMNETEDKTGFESFYPRSFYDRIKLVVHPKKPSTGLRAIDYVMQCNPKELRLFGFDWKETPTFYAPRSCDAMHNFKKERIYIEELIEQNRDRIFLYK